MLLTQCAACAKPLAHDAPRCVRCWTRYCDESCQHEHWIAGHKKKCKKIARGGGAEQFHADAKAKEAAEAAVAESAPRVPAGATCVVCGDSGEGLVRGAAGCECLAHITCLVQKARVASRDADTWEETSGKQGSWRTCQICDRVFSGMLAPPLGWAGWREYSNDARIFPRWAVLSALQDALQEADQMDEALAVQSALIDTLRHGGISPWKVLEMQTYTLHAHLALKKDSEALPIARRLFEDYEALQGLEDAKTMDAGTDVLFILSSLFRFAEAKILARRLWPVARRSLGPGHPTTEKLANVSLIVLEAKAGRVVPSPEDLALAALIKRSLGR